MNRLILFAHGAGAPSRHPWMLHWAGLLGALGRVVRFDYPYMAEGRRRPDRLPVLISAHHDALDEAREGHEGPIYLVGKSMGSRVGCHLANQVPVTGVVCFGYPLAGGGRVDKLRDEVLLAMRTPVLFIQGTRDKLCPLPLLDTVAARMQVPHALHVVQTGDHGLQITKTHTKKTGGTQDDADAAALGAVVSFVERAEAGAA